MKKFAIIVARDIRNGIGKNNAMPWRLPDDLNYFRNITTNGSVIMGRKTFESINSKPLRYRQNIVVSKTLQLNKELIRNNDLEIVGNLNDALRVARHDNIYVIGGEQLYIEALKNINCENIYLTQLYEDYECDTFFNFDETQYRYIGISNISHSNGIKYNRFIYRRVRKN